MAGSKKVKVMVMCVGFGYSDYSKKVNYSHHVLLMKQVFFIISRENFRSI